MRDYFNMRSNSVMWDLDTTIKLDPHYSDPKFKGDAVTVFGKKEEGIRYKTARWVQEVLTEYWGKPVEVRHILSGVNHSNGYSYWVVGYKFI